MQCNLPPKVELPPVLVKPLVWKNIAGFGFFLIAVHHRVSLPFESATYCFFRIIPRVRIRTRSLNKFIICQKVQLLWSHKAKTRSHWASLSCWNTVKNQIVKGIFVASCCCCRVLVFLESYPNSLSHLPASVDAFLLNQGISTRHLCSTALTVVNTLYLTAMGAYTTCCQINTCI